jgi:hypothetical protein
MGLLSTVSPAAAQAEVGVRNTALVQCRRFVCNIRQLQPREVEVVESMTDGGPGNRYSFPWGKIVSAVEAAMPRLHKRGLLSVSHALKTTTY